MVGFARMHQEARRFIDNQPTLGFVDDLEAAGWIRLPLPAMIDLAQVSKSYDTGGATVHALDRVDLHIGPREFVAITGPSGSGKSTLLHLMGGLDRPTSGEVHVAGVPLHRAGETDLTRFRREVIGVVFQFFNLLPAMTARENVALPLLLQGVRESEANGRACELLVLTGLEGRADHFPHELSGGEMQRVAVARALVHRPRLLLADEPTGNLDSVAARNVLDLFHEIEAQSLAAIVLVTHDETVAATAPRRIIVRDGQVSESAPHRFEN